MEIVILLTYLDSVMDMCITHSHCRGEPEQVRMQDMEQLHAHDCHQNIYMTEHGTTSDHKISHTIQAHSVDLYQRSMPYWCDSSFVSSCTPQLLMGI